MRALRQQNLSSGNKMSQFDKDYFMRTIARAALIDPNVKTP